MLKKLFAALMALTLVLGMNTMVFAAYKDITSAPQDIVINNTNASTKLKLYQILEYDLYEDKDNENNPVYEITNVKFVNEALYKPVFVAVIKAQILDTEIDNDSTIQDIMVEINDNLSISTFAEALATALKAAVTDADLSDVTGTFNAANDVYTYSDAPLGYYLVVDDTAEEHGYKTAIILQPIMNGPITVTLKSTASGSLCKNFTDGSDGHAYVGEEIGFRINAEVPNTKDTEFVFEIWDTQSEGLILKPGSSITVKVNGNPLSPEQIAAASDGVELQKGDVFRYKFDESTINAADEFEITYTAVVTEDAIQLDGGVWKNKSTNTADWKYTPDGKDPTDWTETPVPVYTYGLSFIKTNKPEGQGDNGDPLEFAEFTLTKEGEPDPIEFVVTTDDEENRYYYLPEFGSTETTTTTLISRSDGWVYALGLDPGKYILTETVAPDGYNILKEPITIEIVAGTAEEPNALQQQGAVVNEIGVTLPETGGIGTAWFKGVGLMTMLGAAVVLVRGRKRLFS